MWIRIFGDVSFCPLAFQIGCRIPIVLWITKTESENRSQISLRNRHFYIYWTHRFVVHTEIEIGRRLNENKNIIVSFDSFASNLSITKRQMNCVNRYYVERLLGIKFQTKIFNFFFPWNDNKITQNLYESIYRMKTVTFPFCIEFNRIHIAHNSFVVPFEWDFLL